MANLAKIGLLPTGISRSYQLVNILFSYGLPLL